MNNCKRMYGHQQNIADNALFFISLSNFLENTDTEIHKLNKNEELDEILCQFGDNLMDTTPKTKQTSETHADAEYANHPQMAKPVQKFKF